MGKPTDGRRRSKQLQGTRSATELSSSGSSRYSLRIEGSVKGHEQPQEWRLGRTQEIVSLFDTGTEDRALLRVAGDAPILVSVL